MMFVDALLAEHRGEELVADMYDKAAGALTKELGAESEPVEVARARAAAARAGSAARGSILMGGCRRHTPIAVCPRVLNRASGQTHGAA